MTKKQVSFILPVVLGCMFLVSCAPYTITLMNLILSGTVNAVKLAATLESKPVDQTLLDKITAEGNAFITAYTDWNNAQAAQKGSLWPQVVADMNVIQKDFPAFLNGFGITDTTYVAVADFVISEVETLGNSITGTTMSASLKKGGNPPTKPADFKKLYNQKMAAAGHPELELK